MVEVSAVKSVKMVIFQTSKYNYFFSSSLG